MTLNNTEYNSLVKIARKTNCDCWFSIRQDKNGNDFIFDLENRKKLSLQRGITELFEAVIDPLTEYGLADSEITAINRLLEKINYTKE